MTDWRSTLLLFAGIFISTFCFSQEMKMMTYNIKYANENDGENSWSHRKEFITNQLKFYEPDIFGVQEALESQLDHFTSELNTYDFVGVGREDGKKKGEFSAILYKKNLFKVLSAQTFWLSDTPEKISTGWDAALPRICTYALFEDIKSGKKFYFFNTHFDHIGEKARLESAKLILKKIKEINTENFPVVLTGDFNLEPDSEAIQTISMEMNDAREVAQMVSFGSEGTFNGFNFEEPVTRRIDYIFTNAQVKVQKYGVLTDSKEMRYPSDHFPLLVLVEFK
ncbi:endonuclease/exonuclease/phosphatase family protein [Christiangramia antarctica]|uniref:Endonuclease/exonuclease/phosphatase family protein n=2 Tax=Christiangramia TaxID=292691 RepID=A0ABW5X4N9_9FLAO|nr:endonuclease/exonuclease/phosphatase [Gramella sp. AN32]